ncbi:hypothetical protein MMC20_002703 [Loxospora ochrophaea]|nr:hypothetical protein [Loxospora ochrophaea]
MTTIETWIIRIFLLLGILTIGPWALFLIYDLLLYLFRTAAYEVPYFGGRAKGRKRPRAPSLTERPDGRTRRTFSISGAAVTGNETEDSDRSAARRKHNGTANPAWAVEGEGSPRD